MKKIILILSILFITSCNEEESLKDPISLNDEEFYVENEIDAYLNELFEPYNTRVIYKYAEGYIPNAYKAVPVKTEFVKPMADLIVKAWIEPFIYGADGDDSFIKRYFPSELVLVGSAFFNDDGTIVLGVAEAGVRVTVTEVNNFNLEDKEWIKRLFRTLTHEFAHIVDQNLGFDYTNFYALSGTDYTSPGSWSNLSPADAIIRGMVSPYGTSAVSEDFAELVAYIITNSEEDFKDNFFDDTLSCPIDSQYEFCINTKEGKRRIEQKYKEVIEYFNNIAGIDLLKVRDKFLENTQ